MPYKFLLTILLDRGNIINLILASSSSYRRKLLQRLKIPFHCESPDINESPHVDETATELVLRLAETKVRAVASIYPQSLIIGSDQIGTINDEILTKPGNYKNARNQLARISGQSVKFLTGLCLLNTINNRTQKDCVSYTVHFRSISENEVERYLNKEKPYDCTGSFKSEEYGISLVERMEGDDPTSLVGLPLIRLADMLRNENQHIP